MTKQVCMNYEVEYVSSQLEEDIAIFLLKRSFKNDLI